MPGGRWAIFGLTRCPTQLSASHTTKADGTGLGLSTVFGIVSRTAGEIDVETSPGGGTTIVRFPAATSYQSTAPMPLRRSA